MCGEEEGVWEGRGVLLLLLLLPLLLLIADALRRCKWLEYCGHFYSMPYWIPLHDWFISVLSVRPRFLQPCRRPSQVHAVPSRLVQS